MILELKCIKINIFLYFTFSNANALNDNLRKKFLELKIFFVYSLLYFVITLVLVVLKNYIAILASLILKSMLLFLASPKTFTITKS